MCPGERREAREDDKEGEEAGVVRLRLSGLEDSVRELETTGRH